MRMTADSFQILTHSVEPAYLVLLSLQRNGTQECIRSLGDNADLALSEWLPFARPPAILAGWARDTTEIRNQPGVCLGHSSSDFNVCRSWLRGELFSGEPSDAQDPRTVPVADVRAAFAGHQG